MNTLVPTQAQMAKEAGVPSYDTLGKDAFGIPIRTTFTKMYRKMFEEGSAEAARTLAENLQALAANEIVDKKKTPVKDTHQINWPTEGDESAINAACWHRIHCLTNLSREGVQEFSVSFSPPFSENRPARKSILIMLLKSAVTWSIILGIRRERFW